MKKNLQKKFFLLSAYQFMLPCRFKMYYLVPRTSLPETSFLVFDGFFHKQFQNLKR